MTGELRQFRHKLYTIKSRHFAAHPGSLPDSAMFAVIEAATRSEYDYLTNQAGFLQPLP
jgi:hypothetical protein